MNHDFESKEWADNHHVLSDGIARLFSSIACAIIGLRAHAFATRSKGDKTPGCESESTCNQTSLYNDAE
jgi:hypothetical protein